LCLSWWHRDSPVFHEARNNIETRERVKYE
jgi:hypothetical protein